VKPWVLDLYCGAGGITKGLQEAGFRVLGVDLHPQPNYCGDAFVQADAIEVLEKGFASLSDEDPDALHIYGAEDFEAAFASPPCQAHANVTKWRGDQADHPELIAPTRELLKAAHVPYVIENVDKAPLRACWMLCGTMFGLPIRRHRYFETNWADPTEHWGSVPNICGHHVDDYSFDHGAKQPESVYRDAMGCDWMTVEESRQAIPPAYSRFLGERLMEHLALKAAA
jgi:hypothetical protein